jgi:nicotinic acid mononucleotide adenylyltransferase
MKHVEAVIKMLSPDFNVRSILIRRRHKANAWFKRGTLFRNAIDTLRNAVLPAAAREITERMPAARKVTDAIPKEVRDLICGLRASPAESRW